MRPIFHLPWIVLALAVVACGDDKNPNTPDPTVSSIAVTFPGDLARIGSTYPLTATATLSDGTTRVITAAGAWAVTPPGFASVATDGTLSALRSGIATVTLTYEGQQGSTTVRVVPDYQGNWLGTYNVDDCAETGAAVGQFCAAFAPAESALPFGLQLAQDGATVSGRAVLDTIVSDVFSTPIENDGSITIVTRAVNGSTTVDQTWRLNSSERGHLAGLVEYRIVDANVSGSVTVRGFVLTAGLLEAGGALVWARPHRSATGLRER
jgi:hypothetical protein